MNLRPHTLMKLKILFLALLAATTSCSKDNDLFTESLDQSIQDELTDIGNDLDQSENNHNTSDGVIDQNTSGTLKAFPSAEGAGAFSTGGRGGKVLHVTTLEDGDQEGTFRWALFQPYPRIIVFDVSGTIKMSELVNLRDPEYGNLTIAGQTAPFGGITIEAERGFYITRMDEVIIRYVRFVSTSYFAPEGPINHPTANFSGINNLIVDHCSFRYSWNSAALVVTDENWVQGQGNVTVQRSIFADSKTGILIGSAVTANRIDKAGKNSVHHNLFVNISHRFPNIGGNGEFEVINNVAYNHYWRLSVFYNDSKTNLINNYFKAGPSSIEGVTSSGDGSIMKIGDHVTSMPNSPKIYTSGNIIDNNGNALKSTDDNWNGFFGFFTNGNLTPPEDVYRASTRFPDLGVPITTTTAEISLSDVTADVGTNKTVKENGEISFFLDENDEGYISSTINKSCYSCKLNNSYPNLGDKSQLNYPELPKNVRSSNFDTDKDGMPNVWEIANGLNPNIDDSAEDADGDGYTNIEEFLNMVDVQ